MLLTEFYCSDFNSKEVVHSSPVGAGGGGGGGAAIPPALREFSLLKLPRLGFCATMGEGRGTLAPLVSRRPPIPGAGAGGGAWSWGEGGAGGSVYLYMTKKGKYIYMYTHDSFQRKYCPGWDLNPHDILCSRHLSTNSG